MKKMISLLLAAILALSLMAGCAGTTDADPTTEPTEVTTEPTTEPTEEPTTEPTEAPTEEPTEAPTEVATEPIAHDWSVDIPEDFALLAEDEITAMWMASDLSQIVIFAMPYDETVLTTTEEEFVSGLTASLDEGSLVMNTYTTTEVDGFPALYADYTCTIGGMAVHCYNYYVVASQIYTFMFYDYTAEGTRAETFQQIAQSIDILEDTAA